MSRLEHSGTPGDVLAALETSELDDTVWTEPVRNAADTLVRAFKSQYVHVLADVQGAPEAGQVTVTVAAINPPGEPTTAVGHATVVPPAG